MGTVDKALSLLHHFADAGPELGLGDVARLAGFDKATTRRLLVALGGHGMIEQDAHSKRYRLGPGLLRFARLREEAFPFVRVARPIVDALSAELGETVHISELAAETLSTVYVCESARANRVGVAVGESLPFNCTASGFAVLAFGPDKLRKSVFSRPLVAVTRHSLTTVAALTERIEQGRKNGFTTCDQGYEDGVFSIAAPILDGAHAFGAISVASPAARMDDTIMARHGAAVRAAAGRIAAALGLRPTPL